MNDSEDSLDIDEQRALLALARRAIAARLAGQPVPQPSDPPARLRRPQGAFVTLRRGEALRGCIGVVTADAPLIEAVADCAVAAATQDPRFPPVTLEEMPEIDLEISVLGPTTAIGDPREIEIGRHGLVVSLGHRRGLLLPQVATEQGWDRVEFLEQACRKAGLERRAWERGALVEVFGAQVFTERASVNGPRPESRP